MGEAKLTIAGIPIAINRLPGAGRRIGDTFEPRSASGSERQAELRSARSLEEERVPQSEPQRVQALVRCTMPIKDPREGETDRAMDIELKQYLDEMEARILSALDRMRADLISDVELHAGEKRVDAVARKLDGQS